MKPIRDFSFCQEKWQRDALMTTFLLQKTAFATKDKCLLPLQILQKRRVKEGTNSKTIGLKNIGGDERVGTRLAQQCHNNKNNGRNLKWSHMTIKVLMHNEKICWTSLSGGIILKGYTSANFSHPHFLSDEWIKMPDYHF